MKVAITGATGFVGRPDTSRESGTNVSRFYAIRAGRGKRPFPQP